MIPATRDERLLGRLQSELRFTQGQSKLLERFSQWRLSSGKESGLEALLGSRGDLHTHPEVQEFLAGFTGDGARRARALPGFLAQARAYLLRAQLRDELRRLDPQEQPRIDQV